VIVTKRSTMLVLSMAIVLIVGISSRIFYTGFPIIDKYLGDALYAVLFYLILSLFWGKGTPLKKASLICGVMFAIEIFQLTLIPLKFRTSPNMILKAISIFLGTQFGWLDIVAYIVGILGIYLFDRFYIHQYLSVPQSSRLSSQRKRDVYST
jgi:hypothetical protein